MSHSEAHLTRELSGAGPRTVSLRRVRPRRPLERIVGARAEEISPETCLREPRNIVDQVALARTAIGSRNGAME